MCLILFAWRQHPRWQLVVAANRDEFHARPTRSAGFWDDAPQIMAGRDLQAGGTWLGVTRGGRFAALTNVREPGVAAPAEAVSRGELVRGFLAGRASPGDYAANLERGRYAGFNALLSDGESLVWTSNRGETRSLEPGVYGLSNHLLDTPWPKVERGKLALRDALEAPEGDDVDALLQLLADQELAPDSELPDTGVGLELERVLAPRFLVGSVYGTRSSTALWLDPQRGCRFTERGFDPAGKIASTLRYGWADAGA